MGKLGQVVKFLFDRVVALVALVLLGWILLIIAIIVKIKTPTMPAIFKQDRVGRHGRLFKIHKFRTMYGDDEGPSVAYATQGRVTPIGEKLRRYKIDELPELWDVFVGNMSFVGPRPDVPGYADKLEGEDRVILELRPGITGPATLKYRDEESLIANYVEEAKTNGDPRSEAEIAIDYNDHVIYPDKVRINRYYAEHYSLGQDLKMIVCTVMGKPFDYPI